MLKASGSVRLADLAGIQYLGHEGDSLACVEAVRRVIQFSEKVASAWLLTSDHSHAFLFKFEREVEIVVKNGFTSGYRGTGPHALADSLLVLQAALVDIEEIVIPQGAMKRLAASALLRSDLDLIGNSQPVRPVRWHEYIFDIHGVARQSASSWRHYSLLMPWAILDDRLVDLALVFRDAPDKAIMDGFRMLEDRVRSRANLKEHGANLFQRAFAGNESAMVWREVDSPCGAVPDLLDKGEQSGRAQLFIAAFLAFRNPRAHRTPSVDDKAALAEFLVLNQLFIFEAQAQLRQPDSP